MHRPFFNVNRKPVAILREIYSLSAKKMEHVILHKLIYPLFKISYWRNVHRQDL